MILFSFVHSHSVSLNLSQSFMWSNEFRAKNNNLTIRPQCSVGGQCSFKNENDASKTLSL